MRRRILFVDDEENLLSGISRMLRDKRDIWDLVLAHSGQEALNILAQSGFDIVVTDMLMPGMNGAELLGKIMHLYPDMIRVVLSGQADNRAILSSVSATHQFLAKPCDADTLRSTLERLLRVRELMEGGSLRSRTSGLCALPSLPANFIDLINEINSVEASLKRVGEIVSRDIAMSAKVLQLVNSAFFGRACRMSSTSEAVAYLGLDTVRSLALSLKVFELCGPNFPPAGMKSLHVHSVEVGRLASGLAQLESLESVAQQALMAGLLHDSGKLILWSEFPEATQDIERLVGAGLPDWKAEVEVLGVHHGELGAYLLGLWGFPQPIVEAVALHHGVDITWSRADRAEDRISLQEAVRAANVMVHERRAALDEGVSFPRPNQPDPLAALGSRAEAWWAVARGLADERRAA